LHRYTRFRDQFSLRAADDVHAEHLVVFLLGNDLDEALFSPRMRALPDARKRKLADLHVIAGLFAFASVKPTEATSGSQ